MSELQKMKMDLRDFKPEAWVVTGFNAGVYMALKWDLGEASVRLG